MSVRTGEQDTSGWKGTSCFFPVDVRYSNVEGDDTGTKSSLGQSSKTRGLGGERGLKDAWKSRPGVGAHLLVTSGLPLNKDSKMKHLWEPRLGWAMNQDAPWCPRKIALFSLHCELLQEKIILSITYC